MTKFEGISAVKAEQKNEVSEKIKPATKNGLKMAERVAK